MDREKWNAYQREYKRRYREKHGEAYNLKQREYSKRYRENHKETFNLKQKEYQKRYRERHRELYNLKHKEYNELSRIKKELLERQEILDRNPGLKKRVIKEGVIKDISTAANSRGVVYKLKQIEGINRLEAIR